MDLRGGLSKAETAALDTLLNDPKAVKKLLQNKESDKEEKPTNVKEKQKEKEGDQIHFVFVRCLNDNKDRAVWRVIEDHSKEFFVMKQLPNNLSADEYEIVRYHEYALVHQLHKEAKTPLQNVLNVHAVLMNGTQPWLLLENSTFTLDHLIRSKIAFTQEVVKGIFYQVVNGLHEMHRGGVYHCDIKPTNILINTQGVVKLCDFGLSQSQTDDSKSTNIVTNGYKAPELVFLDKGRDPACKWCTLTHPFCPCRVVNYLNYDASVDVFSAGCVLYELFTRAPLFSDTTLESFCDTVNLPLKVGGCYNFVPCFYDYWNRSLTLQQVQLKRSSKTVPIEIKGLSSVGHSLFFSLIHWHPKFRAQIADVLTDPWFTEDPPMAAPAQLATFLRQFVEN